MKNTRYYFGQTYLTAKEAQVVSLLRQCYSPKQISGMYDNSEETINTFIKNVANKLHTRGRAELLVWAMEHGFDKQGFLNGVNIFENVVLLPIPEGFRPGGEQ